MSGAESTWRTSLPKYIYQFTTLAQYKRLLLPVLVSTLIFFITASLGYFTSTPVDYDGNLALAFSSGTTYTTLEILLNNLFVALLAATLGAAIVPALALLVGNGYEIGHAIGTLAHEYGMTAFLLTPHGIAELPAFFLATAAGFRLSTYTMAKFLIADESVLYHIRGRAATDYVILFGTSVVLFVIAAIIETTYTLDLVRTLTG